MSPKVLCYHPFSFQTQGLIPWCQTHLVSKSSLDEAEQYLVGLPSLLSLGLIDDAHHFIDALRQQRIAFHLVDVMPVLITLSSPSGHMI